MLIERKKTWKECDNQKILTIYNEVIEEAKHLYPQYFDCRLRLFIDSSTSHLGFCRTQIKQDTLISKFGFQNHLGYLRYDDAVIVLSKYVTSEDSIRRVLVHEVAHFVSPKEHHSSLWEVRGNKIGAKWGIKCKRLADTKICKDFVNNISKIKNNTYKYTVICKGCGQVIKRKKMCGIIQHPELWKCGVCGEHFERQK